MTYREKLNINSCITCICYKEVGCNFFCIDPRNTMRGPMRVLPWAWCHLYDRAMRYRLVRKVSDKVKNTVARKIRK